MNIELLIKSTSLATNTLANLDRRDVAVWIFGSSIESEQYTVTADFLRLPWKLVVYDLQDNALIKSLEEPLSIEDPLLRKRGIIHIIDRDPSRIQLPPRCLPIYILRGRNAGSKGSSFEDRLRRLTMLDVLRRSEVRELLIVSLGTDPVPSDLTDLWSTGFRSQLTFVSESPSAEMMLEAWFNSTQNITSATFIQTSPWTLMEEVLALYWATYPSGRIIARVRDSRGQLHKIDVTTADEIERPILDLYWFIEERDLSQLSPDELSQSEFAGFFQNSQNSWRPYAAGLPWLRDEKCQNSLQSYLVRLDQSGADENCIAYISSESGAGGTTLARTLAYKFACQGYPALIAKPYPFVPEALPVVNFLTQAHKLFSGQISTERESVGASWNEESANEIIARERNFETPWIIVFDTLHWQYRETELLRFRNELSQSGRPVCILLVTGSALALTFLTSPVFKKIATLNHAVQLSDAISLGEHLNKFLRYYGNARTRTQWDRFYEVHNVRYMDGIAAFWVTLSFWIQGQYDLSESIQQWVYEAFTELSDDFVMQSAVLQIAAMSSERLPLPQGLLPKMPGKWPTWQLLEDRLSDLARIGLTRIHAQGEYHWALVHDILGRLLINALFYDYPTREKLGFSEATEPEHLRFLVLQEIARNPFLGEQGFRTVGEDFATGIFKIDPDHGKNSFAMIWREVLDALDGMPPLLRDTSRVFRHHTAISRRRIAKLDSRLYGMNDNDRKRLLKRAVDDINYALLEISDKTGSESDLNLLNSLAHAYFDLAEVEEKTGSSPDLVEELRQLGNDATRRAYRENPNSSFVVETYVRSLLESARTAKAKGMDYCVEALGILYSSLQTRTSGSRMSQLGRLADQALEILFQKSPSDAVIRQPQTPIDVLVQAWLILAEEKSPNIEWSPMDVPIEKQEEALEILSYPVGQKSLQVLHLRYDLICSCRPYQYKQQIEVLEPLRMSEHWMSAQLQLEYAILLFQVGRSNEGDKAFSSLRKLWQEGEQFVHVPIRLRWLQATDKRERQIVKAISVSDYGTRAFALVQELSSIRVPFRPEEHGFSDPRPGLTFSCYVSFGHNGPFLRPLSAASSRVE